MIPASKHFSITHGCENTPLPCYQGILKEPKTNVLIIDISSSSVDNSESILKNYPAHHPDAKQLLFPHRIVKENGKSFALIRLPRGMSLKDNMDLMIQVNKPFQASEIKRIAAEVSQLTTQAQAMNLMPIIHPELIQIALDGTLYIPALPSEYVPSTMTTQQAQQTILEIIKKLISIGRQDNVETGQQVNTSLPADLQNLEQLLSAGQKPETTLKTILQSFKDQTKTYPSKKLLLRIGLNSVILIVAFLFFSTYKPINLNNNDWATDKKRYAVNDLKLKAHAAAKEWQIFESAKNLNPLPQAIDAVLQLNKGDEHIQNKQLRQAEQAYQQAVVLYDAAMAAAKEIVQHRTASQNARTMMRISESRWQPLLASPYVQLPAESEKANEAALEGDFLYIKQQYQDAIIAYDLARKLYDTIPPEEFDTLYSRHQAHLSKDKAKLAANTWAKISESTSAANIDEAPSCTRAACGRRRALEIRAVSGRSQCL